MKKFIHAASAALIAGVLAGTLLTAAPVKAVAWSDPGLAATAGPAVVSLHRDNWLGSTWTEENPGPENQFCSGVLVSPTWVLTAGHCLTDLAYPRMADAFEITVGIHLPTGVVYLDAAEVVAHPDYGIWNSYQRDPLGGVDLGMIRLPRPVAVAPYQVASIDTAFRANMTVFGFGKNEVEVRGMLGAARVYEDDQWSARRGYESAPHRVLSFGLYRAPACAPGTGVNGVPCEGVTDVRDVKISSACRGDSGGPLIGSDGVSTAVVGIVSYGPSGACGASAPFGAVRVSTYADWIVATMNQPVAAANPAKAGKHKPAKAGKPHTRPAQAPVAP